MVATDRVHAPPRNDRRAPMTRGHHPLTTLDNWRHAMSLNVHRVEALELCGRRATGLVGRGPHSGSVTPTATGPSSAVRRCRRRSAGSLTRGPGSTFGFLDDPGQGLLDRVLPPGADHVDPPRAEVPEV